MGNFTSCFHVDFQQAKLLDVHGCLKLIDVPITAAEIMLQQPGHFVSPVGDDFRPNFKLSALRADEELIAGKLYMLIALGRLKSFINESELAMLRSACKRKVRQVKRRRSTQVLPEVEIAGAPIEDGEGSGENLRSLESNNSRGFTGYRNSSYSQWTPVLEPISE